jgi:hypothetical protein
MVPFESQLRTAIDRYARGDLAGDLDWHVEYFSFLADDPALQRRVGEEFFTARYLYKLLEGLRVDEIWSRRAQVQLQVQQYASIYEACLHHLLFVRCRDAPEVRELLGWDTLGRWSVPADVQRRLDDLGVAAEKTLVAACEKREHVPEHRVRFEYKADAAERLGIVDAALAEELKEFYRARNMIHIHAELKRDADWEWQIAFAREAYRRLEPFRSQVLQWVERTAASIES